MQWYANKSRNQTIEQMLEDGESICHVAKTLNCAKSTVFYYAKKMGGVKHSQAVKNRIKNAASSSNASDAYCQKWTKRRKDVISTAYLEWNDIKNNVSSMAFLGLYWGEGNKRNGAVGVVNNDPGVIKFCYDFIEARTTKNIEVVVRCYPDHDKNECERFWGDLLDAEIKMRDKKWLGKKRRHWSEHGICYIRASDWRLYLKIITWLTAWRSEITGQEFNIDPSKSVADSGLYSTIETI